jgi:hypothetical protein
MDNGPEKACEHFTHHGKAEAFDTLLYVHVVAMELHLNHFPDRLVYTAWYCAEDMWWQL